jgi:tight adherence protein B
MRFLAAFAFGIATAATVAALTRTTLPLPQRRQAKRSTTRRWAQALQVDGVSPPRLVGTSGAAAAATLIFVWAFTGSMLLAVVPAAAVGTLPAAYHHTQTRRRVNERLRAWPDALRSLVASLQAGQSLHQALVELARTGPIALRDTFGRYDALTQHGLPETRSLQALRADSGDAVSDRICEVLTLASTKGSRIALRILRDIADVTAADVQLYERVETAGLEQRINARAVFVLPWLTLVVLCSRSGPFRDYYASAPGARVLLAGAAMSSVGMLAVRRLAQLPTEPRVLLHTDPDDPGPVA